MATKAQQLPGKGSVAFSPKHGCFFAVGRLVFYMESVKNGPFSHTFSRFLMYEAFGNTFVALCFRFLVKWECYEKGFITSILLVIVRML